MGDAVIPVQVEEDIWIYYKNGIFHLLRVDMDDIKINSISFGEKHCGIITTMGEVFTMGNGEHGQLGHGNLENLSDFKRVEGELDKKPISKLKLGESHSTAITEKENHLYQWGWNGIDSNRLYPELRIERKVKRVAVGKSHTLLLIHDDSSNSNIVFSFGGNDRGQLGLLDNQSRPAPSEIQTLRNKNIVKLYATENTSFALSESGQVYSWGDGQFGILGVGGATGFIATSRLVDNLSKIKSLSVYKHSAFALTKNGQLYVWGKNSYGELGLGNHDSVETPILMNNLFRITKVYFCLTYTVAVVDNKFLYSWGFRRPGCEFDETEICSLPKKMQYNIENRIYKITCIKKVKSSMMQSNRLYLKVNLKKKKENKIEKKEITLFDVSNNFVKIKLAFSNVPQSSNVDNDSPSLQEEWEKELEQEELFKKGQSDMGLNVNFMHNRKRSGFTGKKAGMKKKTVNDLYTLIENQLDIARNDFLLIEREKTYESQCEVSKLLSLSTPLIELKDRLSENKNIKLLIISNSQEFNEIKIEKIIEERDKRHFQMKHLEKERQARRDGTESAPSALGGAQDRRIKQLSGDSGIRSRISWNGRKAGPGGGLGTSVKPPGQGGDANKRSPGIQASRPMQKSLDYDNMNCEDEVKPEKDESQIINIDDNASNILLSGYLRKLRKHKNWKNRWVVLTTNGLSYYKTKNHFAPLRTINFQDNLAIYIENHNSKDNSQKKSNLSSSNYSSSLGGSSGSSASPRKLIILVDDIEFYFQCKTQVEFELWYNSIKRAMQLQNIQRIGFIPNNNKLINKNQRVKSFIAWFQHKLSNFFENFQFSSSLKEFFAQLNASSAAPAELIYSLFKNIQFLEYLKFMLIQAESTHAASLPATPPDRFSLSPEETKELNQMKLLNHYNLLLWFFSRGFSQVSDKKFIFQLLSSFKKESVPSLRASSDGVSPGSLSALYFDFILDFLWNFFIIYYAIHLDLLKQYCDGLDASEYSIADRENYIKKEILEWSSSKCSKYIQSNISINDFTCFQDGIIFSAIIHSIHRNYLSLAQVCNFPGQIIDQVIQINSKLLNIPPLIDVSIERNSFDEKSILIYLFELKILDAGYSNNNLTFRFQLNSNPYKEFGKDEEIKYKEFSINSSAVNYYSIKSLIESVTGKLEAQHNLALCTPTSIQVLSETSNLNLLFIVDSYVKIISATPKTNPLLIPKITPSPVGSENNSPSFGSGPTTPRGRTQFLLGGHR